MLDAIAAESTTSPLASRPIPFVLRVLSAIGALAVFIIGLVISLGAILAAPLGMWLVRRSARRQERAPTRIASIVGCILASSALGVLLWSLLFAFMPRPTPEELESAVSRSQAHPTVQLPDWYAKAFPQAAAADSANQRMIRSPEFIKMTFMLGGVIAGVFFGVLGGVTGWGALSLLRLAWSRHEQGPIPSGRAG